MRIALKNACSSHRVPSLCLSLASVLMLGACSPSAYRKPATPPPHAFIASWPVEPGDNRLKLGVKDLIDMKGVVTTAGSGVLLEQGKPAAADAECLRPIRQRRDVVIVGKTNLSEFAVGVSGSNDYFGTPVNPVDPSRVPGGSSSGSAVAVALGLADVALGTDTAGSIRVPAACCGVAGLKTTFGRISTRGVYPISPYYLDTVGPMAKDIKGLVTGMELLQPGFEHEYRRAVSNQPSAGRIRLGRLRIPGTDPAIDRAIDARLAASGFQVVELDEAFHQEWMNAQQHGNLIAAAASWYNNQEVENETGVENRARKAFFLGDIIYSRKYKNEAKREAAVARRDDFRASLDKVFTQVDALVLPVLKTTPLKKSSLFTGIFEARFLKTQCTVAVNYAGIPALAVPVPLESGGGFPVTSIQVAGPPRSEAALLNIGRLLESGELGNNP